jgi:N utilization substance protein B
MQFTDEPASSVEQQFLEGNEHKRADIDYFHDIMVAVGRAKDDLWSLLEPHLDRESGQIDPVERAILLIGCFELRDRLEIPFKVVISEAVELAKLFGATDSYKYVNSILDEVAKITRQSERGRLVN